MDKKGQIRGLAVRWIGVTVGILGFVLIGLGWIITGEILLGIAGIIIALSSAIK